MNPEQRVFQRGVCPSQAPVQPADLINPMTEQADVIGVRAVRMCVLEQPHASGIK